MPKSSRNSRTIEIHGAPDGLEVRPYYKNRQGRFTSMPLIRTQSTRSQEPDLLDLMGELSKTARDLFLEIKRGMHYRNHLALLPNEGLTKSQVNKRSLAIKELESTGKGLACRVPTRGIVNLDGTEQLFRPSTFMISPEYIFPGRKFEEEINHRWKQCRLLREKTSTPQNAVATSNTPSGFPEATKPSERPRHQQSLFKSEE